MAARTSRRKGKRYFRDLREFIARLEETGNLHRIRERIEKNTELMPLVRWQYQGLPDSQRKAFLFDNVTDPQGKSYDCRVAVGVLGASREIYKMALGVDAKNGCRRSIGALERGFEPSDQAEIGEDRAG